MKKILTLGALLSSFCPLAQAQTVEHVTEIVTDYGGYWRSGKSDKNPVQPNASHNLLAFTVGKTRYATGVNNAVLRRQGLDFIPAKYRALPVASISSTPESLTKVGVGQLYDKADQGAGRRRPSRNLANYLTDGARGLDLGTGIANLPKGTLTFSVSSLLESAIGDGVPDILVTQIAEPDRVGDTYRFLDANGQVVGKVVRVIFKKVPAVGSWSADFYEASQTPMDLTPFYTNTSRELRLWAADFAAFGIRPADYKRVQQFQVGLSGNSDQAFVAYNSNAVALKAQPGAPKEAVVAPLVLTPNPARDQVQMLGLTAPAQLLLHDLSGRLVRSAESATQLNLQGLATGVYMLQATVPGQAPRTARLVIEE